VNEQKKSWLDGEIVLPVVLLAVTAAYLAEAMLTLEPSQEGTAGPSFFPIVISAVMIVALVSVLWRGLRSATAGGGAGLAVLAGPAKVALLTVGYILLFKPAGYFVSTTVYVFALLYVFRFKSGNILLSVLWSVLIAGGCFVLFAKVFQIRLPALYGVI